MIAGYFVTTDQARMDFAVIHGYIARSYWATNIPVTTLKKAIANSLCFAVMTDNGEQVGFARMITDRATFAYLADVFVLEDHRGKGLSKWLLQTILAHPDLQGLRRMALATRDAHGLYQQFGFTPLAKPDIFMEMSRPDIYEVEALVQLTKEEK